MNKLLEKFNEFKQISKYKYLLTLENGDVLSIRFSYEQFPHLVGLHKLIDLNIIGRFNNRKNPYFNAKTLITYIKKEILTDTLIRTSKYFKDINERYECFNMKSILSILSNDVVILLNKNVIRTKLKSRYLFTNKSVNGYLHLGLMLVNSKYIPETFFVEKLITI